MKQKHLEIELQKVKVFAKPKVKLEQYHTPPSIAAAVIGAIFNEGDVEGMSVVDLGAGTGMLSVGCALMGAEKVVCVEVDEDAVVVLKENLAAFELDCEVCLMEVAKFEGVCDVVVMNPPFGTKNKGADMEFLQVASKVAKKRVYSMHKTSTRKHVEKAATALGMKSRPIAQLRYNLEATQAFHKSKSVDIDVDLWRFDI